MHRFSLNSLNSFELVLLRVSQDENLFPIEKTLQAPDLLGALSLSIQWRFCPYLDSLTVTNVTKNVKVTGSLQAFPHFCAIGRVALTHLLQFIRNARVSRNSCSRWLGIEGVNCWKCLQFWVFREKPGVGSGAGRSRNFSIFSTWAYKTSLGLSDKLNCFSPLAGF